MPASRYALGIHFHAALDFQIFFSGVTVIPLTTTNSDRLSWALSAALFRTGFSASTCVRDGRGSLKPTWNL
jgi:hypothetical protein